jgi:hypothetical protein
VRVGGARPPPFITFTITGVNSIAGENLASFPLAICNKKIRKTKHVQSLADFLIKVLADLKGQASFSLQSYDLAPHPPLSFPLYQSVMRPPSPLKNPRKLKENPPKNWPRSEDVTTAIEKNPGKDPPAIVFFCSGNTLIQSRSILSC